MTERKVLNKYFPPDYDPSKIPRLPRGKKNRVFNLRTMAPFNMRCLTCKTYIYKARKFNSRMEPVDNEDFLGLRIYRFYIRCPACCSEISWKTDIENNDYVIESGALRTFEATRTAYKMAVEKEAQEAEEEKSNPMKMLENRTKQSKREMDALETLEDLKDSNMKHASMDIADRALDLIHRESDQKKKEEEEDFEKELSKLVEEQAKHQEKKVESVMPAKLKLPTMIVKPKKRENPFSDLKASIKLKKRNNAPSGIESKTQENQNQTENDYKESDVSQPRVEGVASEKKAEEARPDKSEVKTSLGGLVGYGSSDDSD